MSSLGTSPRVLICEDSPLFALALRRVLEQDGDIDVVGVCSSAEQAIAEAGRLRPDLITMDIELPGMKGLQAVERIMSLFPTPTLVLSSHVGRRSTDTAAALAVGAIDAMSKEDVTLSSPESDESVAFRRRVKILSRARVARFSRVPAQKAPPKVRERRPFASRAVSVVGICSSTGGPPMLKRVLEHLPASFPVPILVVQHMAAGFTESLAVWLDRAVPLSVRTAEDGAALEPGVWIAPDGYHLVLDGSRLALDDTVYPGPHRPSGDVLLNSIARSAGRSSMAVVLTGMGRDGAAGAAAVAKAGGLAVAQDEESSVIYGMPKAAVDAGVETVMTPDEIAAALGNLRHAPLAVRA
jgi:two-component system, chemotaxis family, protein-glutamate methylesterase/glutaminase